MQKVFIVYILLCICFLLWKLKNDISGRWNNVLALIYKFWTKGKTSHNRCPHHSTNICFSHSQRSFPVECTFSAVHVTREKSFDEATYMYVTRKLCKKNLNENTQKLVRIITDTKFQSCVTRYKERPLVSKQAKTKCQLRLTFVVVKPKLLFIFRFYQLDPGPATATWKSLYHNQVEKIYMGTILPWISWHDEFSRGKTTILNNPYYPMSNSGAVH